MSFRIVPKSVTLNDLERRNGCYFLYFAEFGAYYIKMVEDTPILSTIVSLTFSDRSHEFL